MKTLTYAQARQHIRTGDTVGIQTGTLGGRFIALLQRIAGVPNAWATHCALAVWMGDRLFVFEMGPSGNIFKPLSQYSGKRMAVCEPPNRFDVNRFSGGVDRIAAGHVPYSLLDLVRIGFRLLPLRVIDTRGWGGDGDSDKVCSLLPAWVYSLIGGDVSGIPKLAAPAEVIGALRVRFEIEG